MWRLIVVSFAFLFLAFYELSGGADFEPVETVQAAPKLTPMVAQMPQTVLPQIPQIGIQTAKLSAKDGTANIQLATLTTAVSDAAPAEIAVSATQQTASEAVIPSLVVDAAYAPDMETVPDMRFITGKSVNMRNGPGTGYSVTDRLLAGDQVQVLQEPGNGWLKLKVLETGHVGWMADWLVSDAE